MSPGDRTYLKNKPDQRLDVLTCMYNVRQMFIQRKFKHNDLLFPSTF